MGHTVAFTTSAVRRAAVGGAYFSFCNIYCEKSCCVATSTAVGGAYCAVATSTAVGGAYCTCCNMWGIKEEKKDRKSSSKGGEL